MFAVNKTTVLKTEDVLDEELKKKVEDDPMATFEPNENDVLCGRGGSINNHAGNENYRVLVNQKKRVYLTARFKREKRLIAASIVQSIRSLNPGGRFLQRDAKTGVWHDIGDTKARDKSSQALREGAPEIRKEIENDRKQTQVMMSSTTDMGDDDDDDYDDEDEENIAKHKFQPSIFKSPSKEDKSSINFIPSQHVHGMSPGQTQHDIRQHGGSPIYPPAHPSLQHNTPNQGMKGGAPFSHHWTMNKSSSRDSSHSHLSRNDRDSRGTSPHHSSPHHHHQSPSYRHQHREQPHSSNSHHNVHYEREISTSSSHQRHHPPSPMDEYRYSRHDGAAPKSSSIPAVQPSKSWGTPGPENYASSRAAYSRYHRAHSGSGTQDQRQLNYSSNRNAAVNLRDRPDRSPIRSPATSSHPHSSPPYYNDSRMNEQQQQHNHHHAKQPHVSPRQRPHNQEYNGDNRQLLAPTPVQPDGQYFDPNNNNQVLISHQHDMRYNNHHQQHYNNSNTHDKTASIQQSSSWAQGDANNNMEGFNPDMPPPQMRLPSWDSDFASNIDNSSVTGDINIFEHDVVMADSAPSNNVPSLENNETTPHKHQLVETKNDRQIVESRVDKDDWPSRAHGFCGQFMSHDWSKIFNSNSFDHGQFCGMELCSGKSEAFIEDDPSKVINSFNTSSFHTTSSAAHPPPSSSSHQHNVPPPSHPHDGYHHPNTNAAGMTINTASHDIKAMHTWDSEISGGISPFGSDVGLSKNIEPIPFSANTTNVPIQHPDDPDYVQSVSSNIFSSAIPPTDNGHIRNHHIKQQHAAALQPPYHYQPRPVEANYF